MSRINEGPVRRCLMSLVQGRFPWGNVALQIAAREASNENAQPALIVIEGASKKAQYPTLGILGPDLRGDHAT